MAVLRVLELFSGIGGMHAALRESGLPAQVVAAVDINTVANQIYTHNFPDTPLWNKTIEGLTLEDLSRLSFNTIMMSPPCQPFTRIGLQGDVSDPRTKSFLHILDLLPRMNPPPRYLLLENVKGFETSTARERLVSTLTDCGYVFREVMASPTSVGIPNSRLRYFLMAELPSETSLSVRGLQVPEVSSVCGPTSPGPDSPGQEVSYFLYKRETKEQVQRKEEQNQDLSIKQIQDFLEPDTKVPTEMPLLPPKTLLRYALILDIVQPTSRRSVCFTKGYGRYVEGTGSVLQSCMDAQVDQVFSGLDQLPEDQKLQRLLKLKLRYFTPREVANLLGFPQTFSFPPNISVLQRYRVLGNSLNVVLVARLVRLMVSQNIRQPLEEFQDQDESGPVPGPS